MYKVQVKASIKKDLSKIPTSFILKIKNEIDKLSVSPISEKTKKIVGYQNLYRIRIAEYRVVYLVDSQTNTITIYKIAHRKDVYRFIN